MRSMRKPVIGANSDGRLELFYWSGPNGGFLHKRQLAAGGNDWSPWSSMGTGMKSFPAAARDSAGRLTVFVLNGDRRLACRRQQSLGSESYADWHVINDTPMKSAPAVATNADDRMEVFCVGDDDNVYRLRQTSAGSATTANWTAWTAFTSHGNTFEGDPIVIANDSGRFEVYVVRKARPSLPRRIYKKYQLDADDWDQSPDPGWSGWTALGVDGYHYPIVELPTTVASASGIASLRNKDNRLETFVRGKNNEVWHVWQEQRDAGPYHQDYSNWHTLGGTLVGTPAVGRNKDGRIEVFARGSDGTLYHTWQKTPNGPQWESPWHSMGGTSLKSDPAVGYHSNKTLEVFCWGPDDRLWHRRQGSPNGGWGEWIKESS